MGRRAATFDEIRVWRRALLARGFGDGHVSEANAPALTRRDAQIDTMGLIRPSIRAAGRRFLAPTTS